MHRGKRQVELASVHYFECGKPAARFTYEKVSPYSVFMQKTFSIALGWHRSEAIRRLELISVAFSEMFVKFDKHIEKDTGETRSLFNSAVHRPEQSQTVLSELMRIGSEVDDTLLSFSWLAKQYLFMLMVRLDDHDCLLLETFSSLTYYQDYIACRELYGCSTLVWTFFERKWFCTWICQK